MKLELNSYKYDKIKTILKKKSFFFFFHSNNFTLKNFKKLQQQLKKKNLKCYKISNNILIKNLCNSKFKNFIPLVNGPIVIIYFKSNKPITKNLLLTKILRIHSSLQFLCLKLNNKLYILKQIKNLKDLIYLNNAIIFQKILKNLTKNFMYNLKKLKI